MRERILLFRLSFASEIIIPYRRLFVKTFAIYFFQPRVGSLFTLHTHYTKSIRKCQYFFANFLKKFFLPFSFPPSPPILIPVFSKKTSHPAYLYKYIFTAKRDISATTIVNVYAESVQYRSIYIIRVYVHARAIVDSASRQASQFCQKRKFLLQKRFRIDTSTESKSKDLCSYKTFFVRKKLEHIYHESMKDMSFCFDHFDIPTRYILPQIYHEFAMNYASNCEQNLQKVYNSPSVHMTPKENMFRFVTQL